MKKNFLTLIAILQFGQIFSQTGYPVETTGQYKNLAIIIPGIDKNNMVTEIDSILESHPNISISQADYTFGTYMLTVGEDVNIDCINQILAAVQLTARIVPDQNPSYPATSWSKWKEDGIFEGFTPDQEVISLRSRNSKQFTSGNGQMTVQFGSLMHYRDNNGIWQDVDFTVKENRSGKFPQYSYANLEHEIKTWYPDLPGEQGCIMQFGDMLLNWWINPGAAFINDNHTISSQKYSVNTATRSGNKISYETFCGITDEMIVQENGIKGNIIINSPLVFDAEPNEGFISFTQFIRLEPGYLVYWGGIPTGNDFSAESFEIARKNDNLRFCFAPLFTYDASVSAEHAIKIIFGNMNIKSEENNAGNNVIKGIYHIHFTDNGIEVSCNIPAYWFFDKTRQFPVTIDPTITIGTGSSPFCPPLDAYYNYHRDQAIYLQSELNFTGTITSIAYNAINASSDPDEIDNLRIWMNTTTLAQFGTNVWQTTGTSVFGPATYTATAGTGWKTITLTTPFTYNNTNNLLVSIRHEDGSHESNYNRYAHTNSVSRLFLTGSDNFLNPPNLQPVYNRPNIRITYSTTGCTTPGAPINVTGTATGQTTANLSWLAGTPAGSPTVSYYWVIGTSPTVTYGSGVDQGITTSTSATTSALTCNTSYYLRVYAFTSCNATNSSYSTSSIFTTSACQPPECPTLISPANGTTGVSSTASLNWSTPFGGGVSYYRLYFGTDNPPTNIHNGTNIGNVLTYSPVMNTNTTYYWSIVAVNAYGQSAGCSTRSFTTGSFSNLIVDNSSYDVETLVENYFISGCLDAENIEFSGDSEQIGLFQGGSSTVGFGSGIILSSGNSKDAEGPNSSSSNSGSYMGAGDSSIDAIVTPNHSEDAAVLEFNFRPSGDLLTFRYVFASEEYNEFVNSSYNDAFGFFISGGPESYSDENIALIPFTSTPVTINNVNNGFADPGVGTGPCTNCAYYVDNADAHMNIECDGLTTILTASASVTACQWYHIKLVVADVSDGILDSWVFLEANSFSSGEGAEMSIANATGVKDSWEGCASEIIFTRTDSSNITSPMVINYTITGTASLGTDYTALPNPVTIPAGDTSLIVPLNTIIDATPEGIETIIITVTSGGCPCNPTTSTDTIFLHDFTGVSAYIQESDMSICPGTSVTLHGIVVTGNYYQYTWTTGGTFISHNQNITTSPSSTTTYNLAVTDSCGNTDNNNNITVTVNTLSFAPSSIIASPAVICTGGSTTLSVSGGLLGTGANWYWYTGNCGGTQIGTGASVIVSPVSTTTYYVRAVGTCNTTACTQVTVTVNPLPVTDAGTNLTIPYGTWTTLNATVSGGSGSYTYLWTPADSLVNPSIEDPQTTNLETTTIFTLLVTDAGSGCQSTDNVTVTVTGGPVSVNLTTTNSQICLGETANLNSVGSGGSGSYSYSWTSIPPGFTASTQNTSDNPTVTTSYVIQIYDGFNYAYDTVTVVVHTLPSAEAGNNTAICYGSATTISASASTGNPVLSYFWNNGLEAGVSHTISPAATTTYSVTVTDGNGCTNIDNVTVTVNTLPGANAGSDAAICFNNSTLLDASSSTGNPVLSYDWNNGLGAGASHTVSPSATTTYTVTVTDGNGCTNTDNILVTVNTLPVANAGPDFTICFSDNTNISASGSTGTPVLTYNWNNGLGQGVSHTVSPASTTTYIVTVTNGNGCTDTDDILVTVNTLPSANAGPDISICLNTSTLLNASFSTGNPALSYNWNNGLGTGVSHTISPATTTIYTVTVTDGNGCTDTDNILVTINTLPNANSGIDTSICFNENYLLDASSSAGNPVLTFNWDNGLGSGTSHTVSPAVTTTYTVTVTDGNGCTDTDNILITVNPLPIINAGLNQTIPYGTFTNLDATVNGGSGTYSFAWTPADSLIDPAVEDPQTTNLEVSTLFTLHVTDLGTGCQSSDNVMITVSGGPISVYVSSAADSVCLGDTVNLIAIGSGGSGTYTFSWTSNPSGFVSSADDTSDVPSSSTFYIIEIFDGFNYAYDTIPVTVNALPIANAGTNLSICYGNTTQIDASGSNGTPIMTYSWNNGLGNGALQSVSPQFTTEYTLTVTDGNNCTDTDSVLVTVNTLPIANAGMDAEICLNDSIVLDASASTGNPVLSFIWDNGLGAGISHIVYPAVTTFYSVTVTDGNGCCNTTGVNISVNSLPIAITSNDTIICFGNNVTLSAASSSGNPMLSYYWDNGLGAGISHFVTPLTTTDYSVTVTDGNGCSAANSVLVTVAPLPVIDSMIVDNVQCYGESSGSVTVNVSAGSPSFSYNWGGTVSPGGQTCDSLPSGTYYVTVSDIYGCTASGLVQISQPDLLTISGDSYPASCSGNDGWAYVMVTGGTFPYSYVWSHDSFLDNDTASGLPGDTYIITVTDGNLCQDTCSVFVDSHQAGNMNAIVISNVQCFGYANGSVSITLTGSTAPYTVIIEGDTLIYADSVIVIDNLPAGSFNFTIIDGNECSFNTTQIITSPPQMTASVQINNIQCYNFDNGSITLNVTGGTPDYSYVWTPGYFSSNPVTSLAPGLYDVSVTDNAGCSFFLQDIAVSQPSPISVSLTVQDIACYGDNNGSITAFVTGGNEPYGYLWSVGSEENTATGLTAGEYMLTVTDANFCISENSATVIFLSDSIKITGTSGISPETRKGYILIDISGGTSPYSFIWSNGQTTKDIYGLSAGEYSVTLTDADNCIATGSYYIETPLIIPNLITPNGDGYNDDFFIQGIDSFDHISIEIFNRWGNKIYTYDGTGIDYLNGNERFNGTWNGEQLPFGGYIYILNTGEGDHSFTGVLSIKY